MSNSIWKTPDQKPESRRQVLINDTGSYYVETAHPEYWDDKCFVDKWCYVDELIAQADKAERLQKEITQELDIYYSHTPGLHPADDCIYAIEKIIGYKKPKETQ